MANRAYPPADGDDYVDDDEVVEEEEDGVVEGWRGEVMLCNNCV